jgi:hypothetical protein
MESEGLRSPMADEDASSRLWRTRRRRRRQEHTSSHATTLACAVLASTLPTTMAQSCISLADSTQCPAFSAASISTNSNLTGLFPFLSSVTDAESFDSGLKYYVDNDFAQLRYVARIQLLRIATTNMTQLRATHWMLRLPTRQHYQLLRPLHHQRAVQCHCAELNTTVRPLWQRCKTVVRRVMCSICRERARDYSKQRLWLCRQQRPHPNPCRLHQLRSTRQCAEWKLH